MNEYDDMLQEPTLKKKSETENPYDGMVLEKAKTENVQHNVAVKQGVVKQPERQAEIRKYANDMNMPESYVDRNFDMIKTEASKKQFKDSNLAKNNPTLQKFYSNPDNVAIAHDDLESLKGIDSTSQRLKFSSKADDNSFVGDIGEALHMNTINLSKSVTLFRAMNGMGDIDELMTEYAAKNKSIQEITAKQGAYVKEFQDEYETEVQLSKALDAAGNGAKKAWNGRILEGLAEFGEGSLKSTEELFDWIKTVGGSPRAMLYMSAQSMVHSIAPMIAGFGGSKAGAALGATGGAFLGSVVPGVGTVIGGGVGSVIGGATGYVAASTAAGTMLQYQMEMETYLASQGVNTSDPKSMAEALRNPEVMRIAKEKAFNKSVTNSMIEGLTDVVGGTLLKAAKPGLIGKVAGAAKATGVEVVGETMGEFGGTIAAEGYDKASFGEAALEGVSSIFSGGAFGAAGFAASQGATLRSPLPESTSKAVVALKDKVTQAKEALTQNDAIGELTAALETSKLMTRDKRSLTDIINESSGDAAVFFQSDKWDDHWAALGENPAEKADELLPGGRADYEKAKSQGKSLEVPLSDYVTKMQDEESFSELTAISSRSEDSMSADEAKYVLSNVEEVVQVLVEEAKIENLNGEKLADSKAVVEQEVADQFVAAGLGKDESKMLSMIYAGNMEANAEIMGTDATSEFQQRRLEVSSERPRMTDRTREKLSTELNPGAIERYEKEFGPMSESQAKRLMREPKKVKAKIEKKKKVKDVLVKENKVSDREEIPEGEEAFFEGGIPVANNEIETLDELSDDAFGVAMEFVSDDMVDMASEVAAAEVTTGLIKGKMTDNEGREIETNDYVDRHYLNTYPSWYADAQVKNKEHFEKAVNKKTGPVWKRIVQISHDRLLNGYETSDGRQVMPDDDYRALFGKEAVDQDDDVMFQTDKNTGFEYYPARGEKILASGASLSDAKKTSIRDIKEMEGELTYGKMSKLLSDKFGGKTLHVGDISVGQKVVFAALAESKKATSEDAVKTTSERESKTARARAKKEILALGNFLSFAQSAKPIMTDKEGNTVYYSIGSSGDAFDIGMKFTVDDGGNVIDISRPFIKEGKKKESPGGVQLRPEDHAKSAPRVSEISISEFRDTVNAMRKISTRRKDDVLFQEDKVGKNLVTVHNLSEENLKHADKMGGLAVPSLAITKKETGMQGFGGITLVTTPELALKDKAKTFGADIYSPRYPEVERVTKPSLSKLAEKYENENLRAYDVVDAIESGRDPKDHHSILALFAAVEGIEYSGRSDLRQKIMDNQKQYDSFYENLLSDHVKSERIFKGFTPSWTRKYVPHTLENVVKIMKASLRGGEQFSGVGAIRSQATEQLKSVKAIKEKREKIVSKKEMDIEKEKINAIHDDISNRLEELDEGYTGSSVIDARLEEAAELGVDSLNQYYDDIGDLAGEITDFFRVLRDAPTEYFEAKVQRAVGIDEFNAAVVPMDTSKEAIEILKKSGITDIETYDSSKDGAREEALTILSEKRPDLFFQAKKAQIDLSSPEKMVISLFKSKDKSSAIHEMGHAFLENMKDMEKRILSLGVPNRKQQNFLEDISTVLDEFGIDDLSQIETKHHEQFARLFEAYVMKGEAPNKKMQKVFNTFKTWLTNIYRNLRGISRAAGQELSLSDEMQEVFNRLIATEDSINDADSEMYYSRENTEQLFKQLGVTGTDLDKVLNAHDEASHEAERLLYKEHLAQIQKKQEKEYKAKKKTITGEVNKEANDKQVYVALESIRTGTIDGRELIGYPTLKMKTSILQEMLSEEDFKKIPKAAYKKDGEDPEVVGPILGYNNGKEITDAFIAAPPKDQYIDVRVQQELDKIYPNYMSPEMQNAQKVEAIDAVHNDSRAKALNLELSLMFNNAPTQTKQILKNIIRKIPSTKEVKTLADKALGKTPIKEVKAHIYKRMENKDRKLSGEQLVTGDFTKAIKSKMREVFNHELYSQSRKAEDEIVKRITKNKTRFKKSDKDLAKDGQINMMHAAQSILGRFGMLTIGKKEKLDDSLRLLKQYDPVAHDKVEALATSLIEIDDKDYKELSLDEFNEVMDTVDALYNIAKDELKILIDGKLVDKQQAIDEMTDNLTLVKDNEVTKEDTVWKKFKGFAQSLEANMTRVEHLINMLDKEDIAGPFRTYLFNTASEAQTDYHDMLVEKKEKINKVIKEYFPKVFSDKERIDLTQFFPNAKGDQAYMVKSELIMTLLHSGNDSNKKKLLLGRDWGMLDIDGNLNSQVFDNFINSMIEQKILTKEDFDGVQKMWDLFEEIKPEIQKTYKRVYGHYFKEVEANEFVTPFGTYRGGYAPAVTDPLMVEVQAARENEISTEQENNRFTFASTSKGFTKERVEQYNSALSLDFRLIPSHVEQSVRFATIQGAVTDINKLLHDKGFRAKLFAKNKQWGNDVLMPWLSRFATQQTSRPANSRAGREFSRWLGFFRKNANMQLMFMNVINTFENILETAVVFKEVKPRSFANSLQRYVKNPAQLTKTISDLSPFMKDRLENQIFEVSDDYRELMLPQNTVMGKLQNFQQQAGKHTYIMQRSVQNVLEITSWNAAYDEGLVKYNDSAKAAKHADSIIRRIMGSNRAVDLATVEAGDAIQKVLLTFYGYFLNKGNLARYAPEGKKLQAYGMAMATPAILSAVFRKSVRGGWDEDDDDEYFDDVFDVLAMSQVRYAAATLPYGGSALRFIEGQFNDKAYDDRLSISPMVSMLESIRGNRAVLTKEDIKGRDVRDILNFYGTLSGVPIGPIGRPLGFMIDVDNGSQKAENPYDMAVGLTTGKSGKK